MCDGEFREGKSVIIFKVIFKVSKVFVFGYVFFLFVLVLREF